MRVLLIHNYYHQRGGEDVIFEQEVDLLRENGITVETLIFTNDQFDGTMLGNARSAIQSFFNWQSAKRLDLAIRQFRPDVVHIHNLFYTASAAVIWTAKKRNIPVVMTLHNYRLVCVNGLLMREGKIPCEQCLTKLIALPGVQNACFRDSKAQSAHLSAITGLHKLTGLWQRVDRFVVVTDFARQKMLSSSLRLRPEQLSVKPNFVADAGYVDPAEREDFFLYVGRLTFEKGLGVLLDAAETDGFLLDIIGGGPLVSEVVRASENTPAIRYQGQQPRTIVLEALKRCRALIVPSLWYEGLPTVILEAFATGTPIICSDQQNLNEIVKDNHTGLSFRTGDSRDLCRIIRNFSENIPNQQRLAQNAYREFQNRYTRALSLRAILTIYEEVIAKQNLSNAVEPSL
ncbi:glycosyltransferase family 4 protein [Spirosoma fluviale]|uniref:Glycosyltransferase involved in cell wall bisynthesis n=1 Tax=Spirosoma fluviale TaxID=1597977 RepID=A0A286F6I7_9BACT|nr:glycosyltransferase family 4 protein [Spirosoma fluviale]SOD78851.1 Glycosyltransferase involved in cell wall bisynthesis [Spirosoma fluviale]